MTPVSRKHSLGLSRYLYGDVADKPLQVVGQHFFVVVGLIIISLVTCTLLPGMKALGGTY